jgi:hypothetical protein
MTIIEQRLVQSLQSDTDSIAYTPSPSSIEHRLNAMYQELRCCDSTFPFTSAVMFKKSILAASDQDAELAYWQSIAKRR